MKDPRIIIGPRHHLHPARQPVARNPRRHRQDRQARQHVERRLHVDVIVAVQIAAFYRDPLPRFLIRADFVGKNVPTSRAQVVRVKLQENDGVDDEVVIEEAR